MIWLRFSGVLTLLLALSACDDSRGGVDAGASDARVASDAGARADGAPEVDTGPPAGGRGIGDPCSRDTDCIEPSDAVCLTEVIHPFNGSVIASYPNGFCSKGCEESSDCGTADNVVCVSQSSSGGGGGTSSMTCTISCEDDSDCRDSEGYGCEMFFGFGFCAP